MVMALDALKREEDACGLLSAGNTGARLVGATFRLGLQDGLKMPALSSSLPTVSGGRALLVDCGANVGATAADLVAFARLGAEFARRQYRKDDPAVALLSVGREPGKGNALLKEAYPLLEASGLNFVGNREGGDLVNGEADVFVCDGYAGNLVLKCTEAVGKAAQNAVSESARAAGLDTGASGAAEGTVRPQRPGRRHLPGHPQARRQDAWMRHRAHRGRLRRAAAGGAVKEKR